MAKFNFAVFCCLCVINCAFSAPLQWSIRPTSNVRPPAREDALFSYDGVSRSMVMFGGQSSTGGALDDTWMLSARGAGLTNFTWVAPTFATSLRPRPRFSMVGGVYQANVNSSYFVLATGDLGGTRVNDVWAFEIKAVGSLEWFQVVTTGKSPEKRYGAVGGIDNVNKRLLISHGFDKQRFSNGFELDLSEIQNRKGTWKTFYDGTSEYSPSAPHARCLGPGAVTRQSELVMFGGCLTGGKSGGPCPSNDGWVYDFQGKKEWTRSDNKPAASWYSKMTALDNAKRVLLYGGVFTTSQVISIKKTQNKDINVLNPSNGEWTRYTATGTIPDIRRNPQIHSFPLSNGEDGVVLWGGRNNGNKEFDTEVYLLLGNLDDSPSNDDSRPWFTFWMLHGILMFLGWGVCLQMGAFVARYFRRKNPFWFKFHRAVQSVGLLLSIIGVVFGFVSASAVASRHATFAHSIIGIIVTIIGVCQPLNAFIRPHPGEKHREIWSFFHKNLGRSALVLALVNISLGLFMALVVTWLWVMWFVFLGVFFLTYCVFEYFLWTKWSKPMVPAAEEGSEFVRMASNMTDSKEDITD